MSSNKLGPVREGVRVQIGNGACALCTGTLLCGYVRRPLGSRDALVQICLYCDGVHPRTGIRIRRRSLAERAAVRLRRTRRRSPHGKDASMRAYVSWHERQNKKRRAALTAPAVRGETMHQRLLREAQAQGGSRRVVQRRFHEALAAAGIHVEGA